MSNPLDDEVYEGRASKDADAVRNGNPGRPQSDFAPDDTEPPLDPSDFGDDSGDVVPGTTRATGRESDAS